MMRDHADAGQTRTTPADVILTRSSERWARMATTAERLAAAVASRFAASRTEQEELRSAVLVGLLGALERYEPQTSQSFVDFAAPILMDHILRYRRSRLHDRLLQPARSPQPKRGAGRLACN